MGIASLLSFFLVDNVFGGTLDEGRTAATTTLIVLGLCFIVLLERGPGREHITVQSYMLALVAGLGAIFAGIIAIDAGARRSSTSRCSPAGQWFLALALRRARARPRRRRLAAALHPAARAARGRRARARRRPRADAHAAHRRVRRGRDAEAGASRPVPDDASEAPTSRPTERCADVITSRTKIVTTIGPATRTVEGMIELIEAGRRRLPAQLLARHPRGPLRERRDGARGGGADRQARSASSATCPGRSCGIGDVDDGIVGLRPGQRDRAHDRGRRRQRRERLSVSYEGLPEAVTEDGLVYLADGRIRLRVLEAGRRRGPLRGRGRRPRLLAPGAQPARAPRSGCRPPGARTSPGSTSRSSTASTCSRSRSCAAPRTSRRSSAGCAPAARTSR